MKIKTYEQDQQKDEFYAAMGEHFASLDHKKELDGWQLYNKDNSTWFLLYNEKTLIGFCAMFKKIEHYYLDNFMILKSFRHKGYANILMTECLKYFDKIKLKTMTNNIIQMKILEKFGFVKSGSKGSYIIYERS
jgi:ribosomal protein S18 acetylase RimI-like enzyme